MLSTSTGIGGPPLVFHLLGRRLPSAVTRDTLAVVWLAGGILSAAALVATGAFALPAETLLLVPATLVRHTLGWRLYAALYGDRYERLVLAALAVTAVAAVITAATYLRGRVPLRKPASLSGDGRAPLAVGGSRAEETRRTTWSELTIGLGAERASRLSRRRRRVVSLGSPGASASRLPSTRVNPDSIGVVDASLIVAVHQNAEPTVVVDPGRA